MSKLSAEENNPQKQEGYVSKGVKIGVGMFIVLPLILLSIGLLIVLFLAIIGILFG